MSWAYATVCIYEDRKDRARIEQVMRGGEKEQETERCGWKGKGGEMGKERRGRRRNGGRWWKGEETGDRKEEGRGRMNAEGGRMAERVGRKKGEQQGRRR